MPRARTLAGGLSLAKSDSLHKTCRQAGSNLPRTILCKECKEFAGARARPALSDPEVALALGVFVDCLDVGDVGRAGPGAAPFHQALHDVVVTLEAGLDAPVAQVADPAPDAGATGLPPARVSKEDTLHATRDEHSRSRRHFVILLRRPSG